jgi:hypothetical protein
MSTYTSFPPLETDQIDTSHNGSPTDTPFPAMDPEQPNISVREPAINSSALHDLSQSREGLSLLHFIQPIVDKVIVQPIWIAGLATVVLIRSVNSRQIGRYLDHHDLPRNLFKLWFFLTYDVLRTGVLALTNCCFAQSVNSENEMDLHEVMHVLNLRVVGVALLVLEMMGCYWTTRFICAVLSWGMFSVVMKQVGEIEALKREVTGVRFMAENLEIGIESAWDHVREFAEK